MSGSAKARPLAAAQAALAIQKARLALELARAHEAMNKARWPAGSPDSKGGQFAPKQTAGGGYAGKFNSKFFGEGGGQKVHAPQLGISNTFKETGWQGSGMWEKPKGPPPGSVPHPQKNDKGETVHIHKPTFGSPSSTWSDASRTATFVPGGKTPEILNGVPFKSWKPPADGWSKVSGTNEKLDEAAPFEPHPTKKTAAGVLIVEPDGRVWLTKPTNEFGGYVNTFPKGTAESGLTLQQNAIKEAYEETGLKIKITGILGDYERDTSKARMYIARRVGGTPKDMGWESQALRLAPMRSARDFLNRSHDKGILDDLDQEHFGKAKSLPTKAESTGKPGHWQFQERWPGGTALGGQWKAMGVDGITAPPKIAGGVDSSNGIYQQVANKVHTAARANDLAAIESAMYKYLPAAQKFASGEKTSSHVKWGAQVHQYVSQVWQDLKAKVSATASADKISGPPKLDTMPNVGPKPGGSNPGGLHKDDKGDVWLVKGNKQLEAGTVTKAVSDDRARNEVLSAKLLEAAGVGVPAMGLIDLQGKYGGGLGVKSLMIDGVTKFDPANFGHVAAARKDFAIHAWLANYDVFGMGFDNTVMKNGIAVNIDPGGALLFRAQGLPKGAEHGVKGGVLDPTAPEWESMRKTTSEQKAVYGGMLDSELKASAFALSNITDEQITKLVQTYGPGNDAAKEALAKNLIQRRDAILAKAGVMVSPMPAAAPSTPPAAAPAPASAAPAAPAGSKPAAPTFTGSKAEMFTAAAEHLLQLSPAEVKAAIKKTKAKIKINIDPPVSLPSGQKVGGVVLGNPPKTDDGKAILAFAQALAAKPAAKPAATPAAAPEAPPASAPAATTPAAREQIAAKAEQILQAAPGKVEMPPTNFIGDTVAYYEGLKAKVDKALASGDLDALKAAAKAKISGQPAWPAKTINGKKMQAYFEAAVKTLEQKQAAATVAAAQVSMQAVSQPVPEPPKPTEAKGNSPAMPDFASVKAQVATSNSNAPTFHAKVDKIATLAQAGDAAGILALKFGTNTYAKKEVKVANDTLAALGSAFMVTAGQKANSHPALTGGATPQALAAAATLVGQPAPQPHPATVEPPKPKSTGSGTDWIKLKPGETILASSEEHGVKFATIQVAAKGYDPSGIPDPPDFYTTGSQGPTGKWKSSSKAVNDSNNAAVQAIYAAATDATAKDTLASITFPVIDKATGQPTGKTIGIKEHPSTGVKEYFDQVTAELQAQTKPTQYTIQSGDFNGKYGRITADLAAKFPKIAYEEFKAHAEKAADYIVLSKDGAASLGVPKPGVFKEMRADNKAHKDYKAASNAKFESLTSAEKSAAKAYTGSAYDSWNEALRKGEVGSSSFKGAQPLVKAFEKAATELPEGIVLWRGIGVGESTYKAVEGGIIQDGSFNSASYGDHPAFSGHSTWLRIHVAKGVKAVHATSFSNFGSAEREIILQNGVRYAVLKVEHHKEFTTTGVGNDTSKEKNVPMKFYNKTIVDVIALPHTDD